MFSDINQRHPLRNIPQEQHKPMNQDTDFTDKDRITLLSWYKSVLIRLLSVSNAFFGFRLYYTWIPAPDSSTLVEALRGNDDL
jgi:hypothetical protein